MNDSELRNAFHQLRDAESARAPRFDATRRAPSRRWIVWRLALAAASLLLIVIALSLSNLPVRHAPVEAMASIPSIVTWRAPTDVLLRTPGSELLSTVPRIPELPERKWTP